MYRAPVGIADLNYTTAPKFSGVTKLGLVRNNQVICIYRVLMFNCAQRDCVNITFLCGSLKGLTRTINTQTGVCVPHTGGKTNDLNFCFLKSIRYPRKS